jgi:hypothetical protein
MADLFREQIALNLRFINKIIQTLRAFVMNPVFLFLLCWCRAK